MAKLVSVIENDDNTYNMTLELNGVSVTALGISNVDTFDCDEGEECDELNDLFGEWVDLAESGEDGFTLSE